MTTVPAVSVVVVSDYDQGDAPWEHERSSLAAVARQDFDEPFEVLLAVPARERGRVPDDLPASRIVCADGTTSGALKNASTPHTSAPLVAVLEADCVPANDWLRHLVELLRAHPEAGVVSSKTLYPGHGLVERCLGLLGRAFLDPGGPGPTSHVSNNSALYRREVLERFSFPAAESPFASAIARIAAMRKRGVTFWFEPRAVVFHAFSGWPMEVDIRRNQGLALVATRKPHRRGWLRLLRELARRTRDDWSVCLRLHSQYGVRWFELPAALGLSPVLRVLEIRGMRDARRGRTKIDGSAYY